MRALGPLLIAATLPVPAFAAWPEDVSLSSMTTYRGLEVLDTPTLAEDYGQVIRELGAAIAGSPLPPYTLGLSGFEISAHANGLFNDVYPDATGRPAPWERVHQGEDPGPFLLMPGLTFRKGLPFSIEIVLEGRWIAGTSQGTFGGEVRAAITEQYAPWPDLGLHLGYTGYVGNDELELGTLVFGGNLGGLFHVGAPGGVKGARIAPYIDVSLLVVTASPVIDEETRARIGAVAYGGASGPDAVPSEAPIAMGRFSGGVEIVAGRLLIRLAGGYTVPARAFATVSLGFSY